MCHPTHRRSMAIIATVLSATALLVAGQAVAAGAAPRIDLRVLVINDRSPEVDAVTAQLDRESIPYTTIDTKAAGRPPITEAILAAGPAHARYQGIVLPDESVLAPAELATIAGYQRRFGIRELIAYATADPQLGLSPVWSGTIDGGALRLTGAAMADGFGYLNGTLAADDRDPAVGEGYAMLGTPAPGAAFTPLLTASVAGHEGTVAGVYRADGRERLVLTTALNRYQTHSLLLAHGLVSWLTRGVNLGYWRNWFTLHVDDIFLPNYRWDPAKNCTAGADCGDPDHPPLPLIRMVPADVDHLAAWQNANGVRLDLAYNGDGSVQAGSADPLTARLLARRSDFRWISHTYSHEYLGCIKQEDPPPWRCTTDAAGRIQWMSQVDISAQLSRNIAFARAKGLPIDKRELVTGEHSGLRSLPQMPIDNPNLLPALDANGIRYLASDASREQTARMLGDVRTVPRHPMNIYYNVATRAEEVDEYNWVYTAASAGGSGVCTNNPASTCVAPLGAAGFAGYIVPVEAQIAFDHVVSADPRPHYAHQSNLAEDRVLYPVLDRMLARYRATFTAATPVVNPRFATIAQLMRSQEQWREAVAAGTVTGYRQGDTVTVVNNGAALDVPATAPAGASDAAAGRPFGEAYGGQRSAWTAVARHRSLTLRLA